MSGYVVSITRKKQVRCLHVLGRCWRVPYLHYHDAECYGEVLPDEADYDTLCKGCWRGQVPWHEEEKGR